MIQFLLSITQSRVRRVSLGGDSSSGVSSGVVENFTIIVGGCRRDGGLGRSHGRDSRRERERGDKSPRHCAHYGGNNHTSHKC